jgi:hypothetical protein
MDGKGGAALILNPTFAPYHHQSKAMKYFWLLMLLPAALFSQTPAPALYGRIINAADGQPLPGASVLLEPGARGAVSDSAGYYRIEQLSAGMYRLAVQYLGYASYFQKELTIPTGQDVEMNFRLEPQGAELYTIFVVAYKEQRSGIICPYTGRLTPNQPEQSRFPASFNDPVRLATLYPGIAGDNDGANGISVRGNTPNGLSWRMFGAEVVNPNHTPNAGTFSDRVTVNGGGVNMISAYTSDFTMYNGPFSAPWGNALSGIMDIRLRQGDEKQRKIFAQAGLIGMELGAEGPLAKGKKHSYLVNYRYATVGLLSAMGVPLGDEDIRFQDLSFHLHFNGEKGTRWSIFGVGGNSVNLFEGARDSSLWLFQKDRYDITFRSRAGIIGAAQTTQFGNWEWQSSLALSALESTREGDRLDEQFNPVRVETDRFDQSKISMLQALYYRSKAQRLGIGFNLTRQACDIASARLNEGAVAQGAGNGLLWQPWLEWKARWSEKIRTTAGLHAVYFDFNGTGSIEPRIHTEYSVGQRNSVFELSYGIHSQLQQAQLYFAALNGGNPNRDLGLTKAHHFSAGYRGNFSVRQRANWSANVFYQALFQVPVETGATGTFSAINLLEGFVTRPLVNEGRGRNYGLELSAHNFNNHPFNWMLNATWYHSRYRGADGVERSTRYDGRFLANALIGKEWKRSEKDRVKAWGGQLRLLWNGGFRDTPIDAAASAAAGETVYRESEAFSLRLRHYFRPDMRLYLRYDRNGRSRTLALDVQNIANRQNLAFNYFDPQQAQVIERFQLGVIPVLSYRIEF